MATQFMFSPQASYGGHHAAYSAPPHQMHGGNGFKNGGFSFRKRVERIDWRKMAAVDVEQISRTLDFNALQDNIMNITFCNVEAELVS
jgi:zinc finger protein DZIP1